MSLLRRIALIFLRSTARGPLVQALPEEDASRATRVLRALGLPVVFRAVGRLVGRFLPASWKARTQDELINRYRISVDLQKDRHRLRECFHRVFAHKKERFGRRGVGDYLEFGVYQGNSLLEAYRVTEAQDLRHVRLFGFDSFAGLPEEAGEEGVWSPGQYRSELEFTKARLSEGGIDWDRTILVPGFYRDTLTEELVAAHRLERASVIMIDCDLYSSAREALNFCEPLIADESALLFDDWHSTPPGEGEQRAFAEFIEENPHFEVEPFWTYHEGAQVFLVRRRARRSRRARRRRATQHTPLATEPRAGGRRRSAG